MGLEVRDIPQADHGNYGPTKEIFLTEAPSIIAKVYYTSLGAGVIVGHSKVRYIKSHDLIDIMALALDMLQENSNEPK